MSEATTPIQTRRTIVYTLLLLCIGSVVYLRAYDAPFFFDDVSAIKENPHIRQLLPASDSMGAPAQSPLAGRPLPAFSFAINYAISGLDTWSYHLFNHLLHLANALLVFLCAKAALQFAYVGGQRGARGAFALSLVWLIHPLHTETVAYTTQRTELLMAFCYLLTLYASMRLMRKDHLSIGWLIVATLACAAGMASKEVMVSAPLAVLLFDRAFAAGSFAKAVKRRGLLYGCLAATWGVLLLLNMHGPRSESAGFATSITPWEYLLTQSGVLLHYLRLVVWPTGLSVTHDWPIAQSPTDVLLPGIVIVGLLAFTVWLLIKRPKLGWLLAMFFLILGPTSSFVPIASEVVAERRMYLPLIFVLALIGCAVRPLEFRKFRLEVVLVLAAVFSVLTVHRLGDYRSEATLWQSALQVYPEDARALNGMGYVYLINYQYAEAETYFRKAIDANPNMVFAYDNLGTILMQQRRLPEAIELYHKGLQVRERTPKLHNNLAIAYMQVDDVAKAIHHFRKAIEYKPQFASAHFNLGKALMREKKLAEAEASFRDAIAISQGQTKAAALTQLALLLSVQGNTQEAKQHLQQALQINPQDQAAARLLQTIAALESKSEAPSPVDRSQP